MRLIPLAVIAAAMLQPPSAPQSPLAARVMRVTAVASGVVFDNPVLHLKGVIEPSAGRRLQIVEIARDEFAAIAVGGGADTLFPIARLPLEREESQILPSDAIVAMTRHGDNSVTLEADPLATLAFLYDIPQNATATGLRLPDGTQLTLK